jgi:hypothetical protein
MADAGTWIVIILGVVLGSFYIWAVRRSKVSRREESRAEDDLDDWDQQDQLEGDEI